MCRRHCIEFDVGVSAGIIYDAAAVQIESTTCDSQILPCLRSKELCFPVLVATFPPLLLLRTQSMEVLKRQLHLLFVPSMRE